MSTGMEPGVLETAEVPLPWQLSAWGHLAAAVSEQRLPHALLLEGAPGTGRNAFAQALAHRLLCHAAQDNKACGVCKSCVLAATGAHPDLLQVIPEEQGKAIGIAAVRNAIGFATRTASAGAGKVLVVSPTESMTTAALNAFLKCLEEPSAGTVILLVFANGYSLPATIRSRCQRCFLASPDAPQTAHWLEEKLARVGAESPLAKTDIDNVLSISGDRPLAALALVENGSGAEALALASALRERGRQGKTGLLQVEKAAEGVGPEALLDALTRSVQFWLRAQSSDALRSPFAHRAFDALAVFGELRAACRAGTNPNPDLLRFRALRAYTALWEA